VNSLSYLRSTAFVTAVHGEPSVTPVQRQSVARAMRHSESTAASSYNAATARDRVLAGLDIATAWRNAAGAGAAGGAPISSGAGSGVVAARFSKVEQSASDFNGESASEDDGATTESASNDEDESDKDDRGNEGASELESFYELEKLVAMRRRLGEVEWLCCWGAKGAVDTWEPEVNVPSWAVRTWFERACEARKTVAKVRAVASLGAGGGGGKRAKHGGGAGAGGGGL
jgi:hypothetical protein